MYADIVVYLKIPVKILTYKIPFELANEIKIGQIVQIDFKGKKSFGLVVKFKKNSPDLFYKVKNIIKIIDYNPLNTIYFDLIKWISDYYGTSLSEALTAIVPSPPTKTVDQENETNLSSSKKGTQFLVSGDKNSRFNNYLKIIEKTVLNKKQMIVCLPRIEDVERFTKLIPSHISWTSYHSKITPKKRYAIYNDSKSLKYDLICGVRSAVFLPMPNLKNIIIDEEEAISHHSDQKPYLSTSSVAKWLMKKRGINLIYGNVIPNFKQWKELATHELKILNAKDFFSTKESIKIIPNHKGSLISPQILSNIKETFEKKGNVFVFLPKQYNNQFIKCNDCEDILRCKNCEKILSLDNNVLYCSSCGLKSQIPQSCVKCDGVNLKAVGIKRETILNELKTNFQNITSGGLIELDEIQGEKFNTVVAIGIDFLMNILAFNQDEKILSLLFKLSAVCKEKLIIQTNRVDSKILTSFANGKIKLFLNERLEARKKHGLPPFGIAAEISSRGSSNQNSLKIINNYINSIDGLDGIRILGPYDKPDFRKDDMFYFQIFVTFKTLKEKEALIQNLNKDLYFQILE